MFRKMYQVVLQGSKDPDPQYAMRTRNHQETLDVGVGSTNETNPFWIEISHKHCTMIRIRRGAAMIPPARNKYLSLLYLRKEKRSRC